MKPPKLTRMQKREYGFDMYSAVRRVNNATKGIVQELVL
jgi:hypothetical protein